MYPTRHRPAARLAQAFGAAGSWLLVSALTLGAPPPLPAANAVAAPAPDRIHLAQAGAAPSGTPVTYASDQADRGEKKFKSVCVDCHGDDLKGGLNGGAPLRGLSFEEKFANGAPASALFLFMSTAMPPDSPGRFSASTYADLMAYILKRNGFQPGAPLPTDVDALDNLIVQK